MPVPIQSLPPETAWLVPLLAIGLVFTILVTLVAVRLLRRLTESNDTDTEDLHARVESLEDEVEELREQQSEQRDESQPSPD